MKSPPYYKRPNVYAATGIPFCLLLISVFFSGQAICSQDSTGKTQKSSPKRSIIFPYALYTKQFDAFFGVLAGETGYLRKEMALVGTAFGSTNESFGGYFYGTHIPVLLDQHLFFNVFVSGGRYTNIISYQNGDPDFPDQQAGSNDSSEDNYIQGKGDEFSFWLGLQFLLPIGSARKSVKTDYVVEEGLLVSGKTGGDAWNPFKSGRTYLEVEPFYYTQGIRNEEIDIENKTNGLLFSLLYDNSDFPTNPSQGSTMRVNVIRDWGWFDSGGSWMAITGEISKYFLLTPGRWFRQGVLALNLWTAETLDGVDRLDPKEPGSSDRPPPFVGSALGGYYRLRAYTMGRFHDRASICYTAEYRLIPDWNPLGEISWLKFLNISWVQLVPFVEVGRVAPQWSIGELHSDMKWDVGLGLRTMMERIVIRLDGAVSPEGFGLTLMAGQPF